MVEVIPGLSIDDGVEIDTIHSLQRLSQTVNTNNHGMHSNSAISPLLT